MIRLLMGSLSSKKPRGGTRLKVVSKRALLSGIRAGQNVIGCLAGTRHHSSVSLFQSNPKQALCLSAASSSGPWL